MRTIQTWQKDVRENGGLSMRVFWGRKDPVPQEHRHEHEKSIAMVAQLAHLAIRDAYVSGDPAGIEAVTDAMELLGRHVRTGGTLDDFDLPGSDN